MDTKECYELARWAVARARECGARDAAADVTDQREIQVQFRDRQLEKLQESSRHALGISVYLNNRFSAQSTNDLRRESLSTFIEEAVAVTKYLSEDRFRLLPDPKYYAGREKRNLEARDPGYDALTTPERIDLARSAADAAARAAASGRMVSVTAAFSDTLSRSVKVQSNGFEGDQESTAYVLYANPTLKDDEGKLVEDYAVGATRHRKDLPDARKIGTEAVERAARRMGQKKIGSAVMDMIVENRQGRQVLAPLIGPLSGAALQQKQSYLEGQLGKKVASDTLTVIDDPFVPRGLESRLFDSEGISARRMPVIEKGILKTYYIDSYYGRKLGMEPTTGASSNLVLEYGPKSKDDIIRGVTRGIFVTGFIGGNSNGTTGDFSFGISGMLIENGKMVRPVFEMNISGNLKVLWSSLVQVGNDPDVFSGWRVPTLHFKDVQFSGI
jgi:PmbA protein